MPYELCATPEAVHNALAHLSSSAHLFVDLEGRDLGCDDGALSILSIGTIVARKIFIFDVLSLDRKDLLPVLDLLANPWQLKIVWDGRMDDVELRRSFHVSFGRVLDLQIADIVSRPERGAEECDRMDRVWHPLYPVRHLDTDGVHALTGLKNALTAHGVYDNTRDVSRIMDHSKWMARPLPSAYLDYAAKDIELIAKVYALFQNRGHVTNQLRNHSAIETQSSRYVHMHAAPVPSNDTFGSSNLLPLEILAAPSAYNNTAKECGKCGRCLGIGSFTYFLGLKGGSRVVATHNTCKVCYLLTERIAMKEQSKLASLAAFDDDFGYDDYFGYDDDFSYDNDFGYYDDDFGYDDADDDDDHHNDFYGSD